MHHILYPKCICKPNIPCCFSIVYYNFYVFCHVQVICLAYLACRCFHVKLISMFYYYFFYNTSVSNKLLCFSITSSILYVLCVPNLLAMFWYHFFYLICLFMFQTFLHFSNIVLYIYLTLIHQYILYNMLYTLKYCIVNVHSQCLNV